MRICWLFLPHTPPFLLAIDFVMVSYEPSVHLFLKLSLLPCYLSGNYRQSTLSFEFVQTGMQLLLRWVASLVSASRKVELYSLTCDLEWNWAMAGAFCRERAQRLWQRLKVLKWFTSILELIAQKRTYLEFLTHLVQMGWVEIGIIELLYCAHGWCFQFEVSEYCLLAAPLCYLWVKVKQMKKGVSSAGKVEKSWSEYKTPITFPGIIQQGTH